MTQLPRYLWDVLADLVEYEEQHGGEHLCLSATLKRLPADVQIGARAISQYRTTVGSLGDRTHDEIAREKRDGDV